MKVTAHVRRDGDWWAVTATGPDLDGCHTQARDLDDVPRMVRDAVNLLTGVPESDIDVDMVVRT